MKIINGVLSKVGEDDIINGVFVIPESVTSIGEFAFGNCSSLTSINIPESVTSIGESAFGNCSSLTSINIPESVTSIEESAFYNCSSLTSINIPESVTSIGESAFGNCSSLTSIYIPEGVTSIGESTFSGCKSLASINIPESVTSIGEFAFGNCSSLNNINIPESVTSIGEFAFGNCSSLNNINIPESMTSIGESAFGNCSSLTSIYIPEGVTSIGESTFSGCKSLASINIPESVTHIGKSAFYNCSSLTSINIPESVAYIGESAFYNCSSLNNINIPESVTSIGESAFGNCSSLNNINIPESVTHIGKSAFYNCSSLTSINIPESVAYIGESAFYNCSSLNNINIPESVAYIGESAFYNCSSLNNINIPESVTSIGESAFYNCSSLTSINIPESVTHIGESAFYNCSSLNNINIPESVTSIGESAFENCYGLEKLITPWGEVELKVGNRIYIVQYYLYFYANHLLKEKYNTLYDFMSNQDICHLFDFSIIFQKNSIQKFKHLFYKMRKQYDVDGDLLSSLRIETIEKFDLNVWNQIKNTFEWRSSEEMTKALAEMMEVFGLFHKDSGQKKRIESFEGLFSKEVYSIQKDRFKVFIDLIEGDLFIKVDALSYKLKDNINIPKKFELYLKETLLEEEMQRIRKISGTYGKQLNAFVKENYIQEYEDMYKLIGESKRVRKELFETDIIGYINNASLHRIFDGCNELYDEGFYRFFIDNLCFILNDEKLQRDVKNIQKHYKSIKNYYLSHSGIEHITLKQAVDYINNIQLEYHKGNYELMQEVQKAGVTDQKSFDYYQEVYEKNDVRRLYSLVRRSNTYEINGYTIKAELLRKDDSFSMLIGEKNYTNCCQMFGGVGHNCMAHAVNSSDGGIFVTRLLRDGEWILLTESWDWQNNNVYCHDNIEGTPYLNHGPSSLKEAVAEAIRRDGETIIEKSKDSVGKYIEDRRKIIEKSLSTSREKELEELRELEKREVIRLVTCGTGNDDLGVSKYFKSIISVNESQMKNGKQYTLSQFQPINYDTSQVWFDKEHSAYSDAKDRQVIIAGSIEELYLGLKPLEPIYRDERRIVIEEKDNIKDYTIRKISNIEDKVYPEVMKNYENFSRYNFSDSHIYLGEDWYLVYEEREDSSIYISDLVKVDPILEDEKGKQNEEMMRVIYDLVGKYEYIDVDLKEDTSYLLYLMNKKLGYFEQIGEDISYPFENRSNTRRVTEEEQESIIKRIREIRAGRNPNLIMHKVRFKKGRLLSVEAESFHKYY